MKKNEWNDFINEQLDMKCKLIDEISTELLNLENLNYDFVTSGKIEEESVKLKIDDEYCKKEWIITYKDVYSRCVADKLTPEEAIKKIIKEKIEER